MHGLQTIKTLNNTDDHAEAARILASREGENPLADLEAAIAEHAAEQAQK